MTYNLYDILIYNNYSVLVSLKLYYTLYVYTYKHTEEIVFLKYTYTLWILLINILNG